MTRYRTSPRCGISLTVLIGSVLDTAPRPYTVAEIVEISRQPTNVVTAFLKANSYADHVSWREMPRDRPHEEGGKPVREYWRGDRTVNATFSEGVGIMDEKIGKRLEEGERPVSWRDGTRTVWSIDETETVSAMRGNNVIRMGRAEKVTAVKTGYTIRIRDGPVLKFKKEAVR